ncbi:AAA family ATPase [Thiococcus pfennigii]|uniref:AAA family ATPase n=1 Tax=Thiococcus pfennigii TaxID=1057 RepID=UPI001903BDA1|nr:AAA family ATPase [Thiococcus pfennigii]
MIIELDFERLSGQGYLTPASSAGQLVEEYRVIKRRLLKRSRNSSGITGSYPNPVLVTSALPKEGKTFTAFNLAISLAMERDISVLLVDADLAKRSLSVLTRLERARGVYDLLADEKLDPAEVIVETNVPKLLLIPAGMVDTHATELLSSLRMRHIVQNLAAPHSGRIVLMDSAPVLSTSQGMALYDLAAQILFVVEEGKTAQQAIMDAISQFDEDKAVGLILNKVSRFHNAGYSSYYGEY